MITQKLKVNLIPSGIAPRVNVSQYDYGSRTLEISLYNGTEPFMIPENANIFIQGTKKDGRGFQYEGLAYNDNVVTADITQQMTVFEDEVVTELVIVVDEEQLATANFILNVEPAALRDDVVVSETDIPAIQTLPEAMAEVRAAVVSTAADAQAASGSATAAANSADSASGSATAASGSATAAGNSADDAEAWAVGKIDGVDVPSTDPRHNNNAKHYSDTASGYSTSAAQSATAAAASELHAGTSETNAHTSEVNAAGSATSANSDATLSESWAVGGTGTRSGEDTNNAKYWAEQAASSAGGHFVSYDQQTLTPAQKTQARDNIGATDGLANASDTQFANLQDGDGVIWSSQLNKFVNGEVGMRIVQIPQPKTVQGQPKEYTYDGTQQTFEWDSIDSAHILLQNENQINAGNYNVIASLKGSGDLWTDMTNAPKPFAWTIAKAQGSFSLSANSASVDVNNPTATVNVTNVEGDGVISVASDDDNVATASISNGVITITGVSTGTATITVTMADGTNYLGDSHTISVAAMFYRTLTVNIDETDSNPATCCSYADDAVGMTQAEIQTFLGYKPCLFVNGAVDGYLNPDNYAQYEDGTNADITTLGNDVMIEFPKRGYKISRAGNTLSISITDDPNAVGFSYKPFSRTTEGDKDAFYFGAYEGYISSGKMYSSSGKTPSSNQLRATFRGYATARGTGYYQNGFYQLIYLQCCYLIQFANLDSQTTIGAGYVGKNLSSSISTGAANSYGMNCEIIKTTNPSYMTDMVHSVKCLGIENLWGNIWQYIDGITTDSIPHLFTCYIPSLFSDSTSASGQTDQGAYLEADGYLQIVAGNSDTGFAPNDGDTQLLGSETTYYCDGGTLIASSYLIYGGRYSNAKQAGIFNQHINYTGVASNVGSRLMYV